MSSATADGGELAILGELAELHGIVGAYHGIDGRRHEASAETLLACLNALGVDVDSVGDARAALAWGRETARRSPFPPVLVHDVAEPVAFHIAVPDGVDLDGGRMTIELEDGSIEHEPLGTAVLSPRPSAHRDDGAPAAWTLTPAAFSGRGLPPGYHRLALEASGWEASALVLSSPRCPEAARAWGAFLPLHALRTATDRGVASYRDLADLARFVGGLGASFVATLPLFPAFLDGPEPVDPSPYLPVSRLAWNELYVDWSELPELAISEEARALAGAPATAEATARLRAASLVDYASVWSLQRAVLRALAASLFAAGQSSRRDDLERWLAARPDAEAYARFRGGADESDVNLYRYAQWIAEQQIDDLQRRSGGVGLHLDLPIGVHPAGFDTARWPASFVAGVHGGAPPDDFATGGQDWAFPPLHPERIRRDGYRYVIAAMRQGCAHARSVRLDHVMGLHRLWWVPETLDARHGAYVRYPSAELRAIVAIEADRHGTVVVGEDLGTVPDGVREAMAHDRMLRSFVMQFAARAADPLPEPPELAMASLGTHDLAPFASFYGAADAGRAEWRVALAEHEARTGQVGCAGQAACSRQAERASEAVSARADDGPPVQQALACCLGHLARSRARLVQVDLEDLWLETEPQNCPGTGVEAANWRRRAAVTLDEMRDLPSIRGMLELVNRDRAGWEAP